MRTTIIAVTLTIAVLLTTIIIGSSFFGKQEVWDCTFQENELCVQTNITRFLNCEKREEIKEEHCRTTNKGIEKVTLFTDPENYLTSPITQDEYVLTTIPLRNELAIWDLQVHNNTILFTEMQGVLIIQDFEGKVLGRARINTSRIGNTGLLGLAIHPEFSENNKLYLYYHTKNRTVPQDHNKNIKNPIYSRVSQFTLTNNYELVNETIMVDNIEGNEGHAGGRIRIQDDYLYITTGDSEYAKNDDELLHKIIQEKNFLGGKVLRVHLNGSIPQDNPYPNSPVYALGLRNPQGIAFHPTTKEPYTSMHGPWRHDEINHVRAGDNFGWPTYRCEQRYKEVSVEEHKSPTYCFDKWTIAPSGMVFVDDEQSPWHNDLFIVGLRSSIIFRLTIDPITQEILHEEIFYFKKYEETKGVDNRLRSITYYNGSLIVTGDGHGAIKITPQNLIN